MMEHECSKVVVIATNSASATSVLDEFQLPGKPAALLGFITLKVFILASR
jgi:hypothetical protein